MTFTYGEESVRGLQDVSLHIQRGETVVLCGESGSGKSTLTRLINGLVPHFYEGDLEGDVLLDGRRISDMQLYELAGYVGSVLQNPRTQFYNVESTAELAFGCENLGVPAEQIEQRITRTAGRLALKGLLDRDLFEMSGGEKQLIACGSADTIQPEVVVLDEPSSNLDLPAIRDLAAVVQRWRDDGKTLVIAEHRLFYLLDVADRFVYVKDGRIEREFAPEELRELAPETLAALGLRAPDPWRLRPAADAGSGTGTIRVKAFECVTKGHERLSIPELALPRGEVIAMLGRNGAGKTTFARTLCALERSGRGEVEIDGVVYGARKRRGLAYMVMQDVNHQLFAEDAIDELLLSMDGVDPDADAARADEILRSLDLDGKADRHPMSLSGGEKQRLAIGGAIAAGREILVLDEPTSGLDYRRMIGVAGVLRAMSAKGRTLFVITHDIEFVLRCCGYAVCLAGGRVVHSSRVDEAGVRYLREFFR
nr:ABC transporter ATP-binding protein [uncultured Propionibacterium sp.]